MLRRLQERLDFTRGLGFRLGTLLSVAILPIGLISLVQNLHLSREAERSAEIALLGRTASAAAGNARCCKARWEPPMRWAPRCWRSRPILLSVLI